MIEDHAREKGISVELFQSNHEGAIIDKIQEAYLKRIDGIVINPGAYTHYSYAIRDAIAILSCPVVEVHISDVMNREDFRKLSVIEEVCTTRRFGHGFDSYIEALEFVRSKC